jgi:hypothetical protein
MTRARCLVTLAASLAISTAISTVASATPFRDEAHGLSLDVPADYHDFPTTRGPGVIGTWSRGEQGHDDFAVLQLQGLGGTVGREPIDHPIAERAARATLPAGVDATFAYRKTRWHTFDLELMVTHVAADPPMVVLAAQIPLAKEAVQVNVIGPATGEARLSADLDHVLASLDGRSNWLTDDERSRRLGTGVGFGLGAVVGAILIVRRVRRRRARA